MAMHYWAAVTLPRLLSAKSPQSRDRTREAPAKLDAWLVSWWRSRPTSPDFPEIL